VDEEVNLSDYAGQKVLLRFEMVTDAGVNREGIAIDNIEIPEIGFVDNAESNSGWNAEGFILANNTLPQFWQLQLLITNQAGQTRLERVTLENNTAEVLLDFGANDEKARRVVVAISATTPVTTEPGSYELRLR
jgi:bacillopeptidase F (M6 metalloprotease family)